jgi:hypothetical protein
MSKANNLEESYGAITLVLSLSNQYKNAQGTKLVALDVGLQ